MHDNKTQETASAIEIRNSEARNGKAIETQKQRSAETALAIETAQPHKQASVLEPQFYLVLYLLHHLVGLEDGINVDFGRLVVKD